MPGCSASPATSPGNRALSCSAVARPSMSVNDTRPRLPEASTITSASAASCRAARLGEFVVVCRTEHDVAVDHVVAGGHGEDLADPAVLVAYGFGQGAVEVAPSLRCHHGNGDVDRGGDERVDELLERLVVALEEGRALGLAVVGQHDDVIRAGRLGDRVLEPCELLVESAQRVEGGRREQPRVMGDLVVADEVGVGGGHTPVDVAHQRVDRQVAQDRGRGGTQDRVDPTALELRLDAVASGAASIDDLAPGVREGQREQSTDRVRDPTGSSSPCGGCACSCRAAC